MSLDPEATIREVIRHWSRFPELAEFAAKRHGFADSDGGFGVLYPDDLDEYDREVDGVHIPPGQLQLYGFWGPPEGYEILVSERLYLNTLAGALAEAGHTAEAARVRALAERQGPA